MDCDLTKEQLRDFYNIYYPNCKDNKKDFKLTEWTWEIHNEVNKRLGKPEINLDNKKK